MEIRSSIGFIFSVFPYNQSITELVRTDLNTKERVPVGICHEEKLLSEE
jgi:hypothetical protein